MAACYGSTTTLDEDTPHKDATTSKMRQIPKETQSMDATEYYDLLINGYLREIEGNLDVEFVPDEIKKLCIEYYYIFLRYNKYCHVQIKNELNARKLLIQTRINNEDKKMMKYGGRLVSRIPINTKDDISKSKVTISLFSDEEFVCVAIANYYTEVGDEMDLIQDEEYMIMRTTSSGWWYAVNNQDEGGWIPSNYVKRKQGEMFWNGVFCIGVTTNPELFINASMTQQPFEEIDEKLFEFEEFGVTHSIYRDNENVHQMEQCGYAESEEVGIWTSCTRVDGGIFRSGEILDVWIEDGKFNIYIRDELNTKMCDKHLSRDCDGNIMDYYFAMVFSVDPNRMIKYEISADFV